MSFAASLGALRALVGSPCGLDWNGNREARMAEFVGKGKGFVLFRLVLRGSLRSSENSQRSIRLVTARRERRGRSAFSREAVMWGDREARMAEFVGKGRVFVLFRLVLRGSLRSSENSQRSIRLVTARRERRGRSAFSREAVMGGDRGARMAGR